MQKYNELNNIQKSFILKHNLRDINLLKTIIPVDAEVILDYLDSISSINTSKCHHIYPKGRQVTPHDKYRWSDKELTFLKINAKKLTLEELASNLGRTENSVIGKAYREGIDLLTRKSGTKYE